MIESVQARQRGAVNFQDHYENLCALQDSVPLPAVKTHLAKGVLDLNGDRIRLTDWQPIINSIRINKSLQLIAVRSCYQQSAPSSDDKRAAIMRRKIPAIRSKEITHRLMKALKECLFVSPTLSCIELQGLSLRERDLQVLVKGISKSQTLGHLSLEMCRIGDSGMEVLCGGLKNTKRVNSINLSGCCLSPQGAEFLASLIKHQGMQRHTQAWQDSLRYRRPDLDRMSGIRRVTINNNPLMGDQGARLLADTLKDDLWLKALDMQACGISSVGAKSFLDVLKYNTTLVVLDLRRNPLIGREELHAVMEQLMLNSNGQDQEYKWMKAEDRAPAPAVKQTARSRRRVVRVLNGSNAKKTSIKNHRGNNSCSCCGRVTPTCSRRKGITANTSFRRQEVCPEPGLPWRTALRASRFRCYQQDGVNISFTNANENNNMDTDRSLLVRKTQDIDESSRMKRIKAEASEAMKKMEESHMSLDLTNPKEVLVELEQMRRHLKEERLARARADQQVIMLMIENRKLAEEINLLKKAQRSKSIMDDDSFLDSIESAFRQFHSFIDMLKEAGLGQLVTMAGLDKTTLPIISGNINNNNYSNASIHITSGTSYPPSGAPMVSHTKSNGSIRSHQPDKSSTPACNTTLTYASDFANKLLVSSSFVAEPKHVGGDPAGVPASFLSTHQQLAQGHHDTHASPIQQYDQEKDAVRKEADELYSRLVTESRVALGQETQGSGTGRITSEDGQLSQVRNNKTSQPMDVSQGSSASNTVEEDTALHQHDGLIAEAGTRNDNLFIDDSREEHL